MSEHTTDNNPLIDRSDAPRFEEIRPEHVEPAVKDLLAKLNVELETLEKSADAGRANDWESLVEPYANIGDRLELCWGVVGHLTGVRNTPELRASHEAMQPAIVEFATRLGQSRPLYDALERLRDRDPDGTLDVTQKRILDSLLLDARLSGVSLDGAERERFNAIQLEMAELGTRFGNNVLDATKAFALELTEEDEVAGLPASARALAAQSAREAGAKDADPDKGPWRITLDAPALIPFLEHSRRRDLREQLYRAYLTRAGSGESDNSPIIERILTLRGERARLLGFATHAETSLASKMAPDVASVEQLLGELRAASHDTAVAELNELADFARSHGSEDELAHWDVAYWAERMREQLYELSDEELRPYFPLPSVLEGLFALAARLFDIRIEAADGEVQVWHPDVRYFRVTTPEGEPVAAFYLDPYSRPAEKRGGAWMDECVGRSNSKGATPRLPVAYVICNQSAPVGDNPSLMTFSELRTIFHEFGHALQHMLTRVDHSLASGIRGVEWDAVELPSQFMENWCYHKETLLGLSRHVDSGEALPDELFDRIVKARNFRSASAMLRQIYFATLDLELHHRWGIEAGESVLELQRRVAADNTVLAPLAEDRFLCSFGHIFAGGYAAGYYSYKWAEVLSADAFAAFEDAGLDDTGVIAATGKRFRDTVLALGGSRPPMEVFEAFRGREPSSEALLRHSGLAPAGA